MFTQTKEERLYKLADSLRAPRKEMVVISKRLFNKENLNTLTSKQYVDLIDTFMSEYYDDNF